MTPSNYIIRELKKWEEMFPTIILRYAYENDTHYHVITVEPNELYKNNSNYIIEENKLWDSFRAQFPDEEILISQPNECLEMENLLYQTGVEIKDYDSDIMKHPLLDENFSNKEKFGVSPLTFSVSVILNSRKNMFNGKKACFNTYEDFEYQQLAA